MRSIPSNSDQEVSQPLTRQLQNWKWPRREVARLAKPASIEALEARPICLSTVVLGDVILDFESFIIVIGGHRTFPSVPHFWIAVALLFADGDEVTTAVLSAIRTGTVPVKTRSLISRDIRHLSRTLFTRDPRIRVTGSGRGYRLTWDALVDVSGSAAAA